MSKQLVEAAIDEAFKEHVRRAFNGLLVSYGSPSLLSDHTKEFTRLVTLGQQARADALDVADKVTTEADE